MYDFIEETARLYERVIRKDKTVQINPLQEHIICIHQHWTGHGLLPGEGGYGRQNPRLMELLYRFVRIDAEAKMGK